MINYPHAENAIPHSISNATRISNEHVGEPGFPIHWEVVGRSQDIYA